MQEASPLLSLGESRQRVKELLCWSAEQRLQVHVRLCEVLDKWRADWGLSSPPSARDNTLADEQAERALAVELFGPASETSAARSIAKDAWADWCSRLDVILGKSTRLSVRPAQSGEDTWDGSLDIHLPWWGGTWNLRLPAEAVRLFVGNTQAAKLNDVQALPPIGSLGAAIANEVVHLSVQFKPISLTLGQIQMLRLGDVVPIDHRLADPIAVDMRAGDSPSQLICHAWLGQRNGRVAIELTR